MAINAFPIVPKIITMIFSLPLEVILLVILITRYYQFLYAKHGTIMPIFQVKNYSSGEDFLEFFFESKFNMFLHMTFWLNLVILIYLSN